MIQMYNSIVDGWFILWFVKAIFFANIIPIIFGLVMFIIECIHYLQLGCMIYFLYCTLPTLSELKYIYYENISLIFYRSHNISFILGYIDSIRLESRESFSYFLLYFE